MLQLKKVYIFIEYYDVIRMGNSVNLCKHNTEFINYQKLVRITFQSNQILVSYSPLPLQPSVRNIAVYYQV